MEGTFSLAGRLFDGSPAWTGAVWLGLCVTPALALPLWLFSSLALVITVLAIVVVGLMEEHQVYYSQSKLSRLSKWGKAHC